MDSKGYTNERTEVAKQIAKLSTKRTMLWQKHQVQKLDDSIHKEHYDRMQKLTQNEKYAKKMVKVRSKTVEPVMERWSTLRTWRESIHEASKRKQTRINGKFNLQLEKNLRFITKNQVF